METVYFEDIKVGEIESVGGYVVTKEDIINFATEFDPQPVHLDEQAAKASVHGGLIASACLTISLSAKLLNQRQRSVVMIAGGGWDDVRFPTPVRPGDRLNVTIECIDKRESKSKFDRGIVRFKIKMVNQNDIVVLTYNTSVIAKKRFHQQPGAVR